MPVRIYHNLIRYRNKEQEYYIVSGTMTPKNFFDVSEEYSESESADFSDILNTEENENS